MKTKTLSPGSLCRAILLCCLCGLLLNSCNQDTSDKEQGAKGGSATELATGTDAAAGAEMDNENRTANHLKNETSLYLQQHMYNPVDWYPWGDEAFNRAKEENKIIFLSIGYSSCHWCHVMEEEVFEDVEAAEYMNEHFICIKVDREERPDIDATYMMALQGLTRGGGGWPLNMFLTPARKPITGSTYMPKTDFMALTLKIVQTWDENREQIMDQSDQVADFVAQLPQPGESGTIDQALLDEVLATAEPLFDNTWGGFQAPQKFPTPVRWQYLLHYYRKTGNEQAKEMVVKTLDEMMRGGIYDHIGGGFHRYAVDESWSVPHFEKLLYDNAQLASLYIEAGELFDNDAYRFIARDTLDFLLREMQDAEGGFYSSFDADSDGVEGSYYCFTPAEMVGIAGETDGAALNSLFGITEEGNFEDFHGKISNVTVLSRRAKPEKVMEASGLDAETVAGLFDSYRQQIRDYRAKRVPPTLDRKIVTSWNGLALSAFSAAYSAYGDEQYREAAERIAHYLTSNHSMDTPMGSFHRASTGHVASGDGVLDDYACIANGMLDLYLATGDERWLQTGLETVTFANEHFRAEDAGWYLTADYVEQPLGRRIEVFDTVEPSGNSQMLKALLKVAAVSGEAGYFATVSSDLEAYHEYLSQAGLEMANWLDVALLSNGPYYELVVAGDADDPLTIEMLNLARSKGRNYVLPMHVPAEGPSDSTLVTQPMLLGKAQWEGKPTAFVCKKGACNAPTSDPQEMLRQISEGWAY